MALRYLSPLHKASRRIGEYLAPRMGDLGVSNPEAHTVSYLRHYGPCPVGQLVRVFGFRGSTLTSLLDRLEEKGLVSRELHPEDRRSFLVGVTPAGRRTADRVQRHLEDLEAAVTDRITTTDLEGFRRVMSAIEEATRAPSGRGEPNP